MWCETGVGQPQLRLPYQTSSFSQSWYSIYRMPSNNRRRYRTRLRATPLHHAQLHEARITSSGLLKQRESHFMPESVRERILDENRRLHNHALFLRQIDVNATAI